MVGIYENVKNLIENTSLYFEGHLISKELLLKNYAIFLASNFEKKHNVSISLHTGSICFDIITILFAAVSNILYNQDTSDDVIDTLVEGQLIQYKTRIYEFGGFGIPLRMDGKIIKTVKLVSSHNDHGVACKDITSVPQTMWGLIKPYNGNAKKAGRCVTKFDVKKRNDFINYVFYIKEEDIPAYVAKSSVVVMNKERAAKIIENLEILYSNERIKLTEIVPISYCSDNEEYPFAGNPGKIEPAVKITNNISTARSLVTGTWNGNDNWENDVIGVAILGFGAISRSKSEVVELMKRRKLKYVFLSYNISSDEGETLFDAVEDISVFACTTEYLLNNSMPGLLKNPYTIELDKQVEAVLSHDTISVPVKTFDCDWQKYKNVQLSLARIRKSGYKEIEEFVPLAYSLMNLMITTVFPFILMENMVESGLLEVESPLQRIIRLTDMISSLPVDIKDTASSILSFLEDGYSKLLTDSPKQEALFKLLEQYRNKKVAIIVPKAYYANILYNLNVLEYFDNNSQLCISTANKFDFSQQYDAIIAIGAFWGKKFDPFRCRASSNIYVIVSAVEENLFKCRRKLAAKIEREFNVRAKTPTDYEEDIIEEYSDGATEEEILEVIDSSINVADYINRIFESKSIDILNSGNGYSTTEISHIATCADGERIFFTKKYRAYVFDSAKEDVAEVPVEKLSPGDTVIFKSNNSETKDIVTTLLDKYIDEYKKVGDELQISYLKARYWKEVLREYRVKNNMSFREISERMEKYGAKKHVVTIQTWLAEDSYIVGPQDCESYRAIAEMTKDTAMLDDPDSFCASCERIRSIRVGILKLIAKTIISKYSGNLVADDDMSKVVSENIDDISVLVQIETITPVEDKKAPINMVNRPIAIN